MANVTDGSPDLGGGRRAIRVDRFAHDALDDILRAGDRLKSAGAGAGDPVTLKYLDRAERSVRSIIADFASRVAVLLEEDLVDVDGAGGVPLEAIAYGGDTYGVNQSLEEDVATIARELCYQRRRVEELELARDAR